MIKILENKKTLIDLLYQLADDELTIGHRDSEWLGLCPDIEGDVAFSSIAQDEVGHALFFFDLLHNLGEKDPDFLAFARTASERKNCILVERPNNDWAYSIVRHYFYDIFDYFRLEALTESSYPPLRHGACKIIREEYYHLLHFERCFCELATGSEASKTKIQAAVYAVWADLDNLFNFGNHQQDLHSSGIITTTCEKISYKSLAKIRNSCENFGIRTLLELPKSELNGRLGDHSDVFNTLLSTMSEVYRLDPVARW